MDLYVGTPHPEVSHPHTRLFNSLKMAIAKALRSMMLDASTRELFPGLTQDGIHESHPYKSSLFTSGGIFETYERQMLLDMVGKEGLTAVGFQTASYIHDLKLSLQRLKSRPNFSLKKPEGGENTDVVTATLQTPGHFDKLSCFLRRESFTLGMMARDLQKALMGTPDDKTPVRRQRLGLCESLLEFNGIEDICTFMGMVICGQVTRNK
jgi:hypothetical protein